MVPHWGVGYTVDLKRAEIIRMILGLGREAKALVATGGI